MLVETASTSLAWHPAVPHVSGATRRSPGFTNFTYSADSFSHVAYKRSGRPLWPLKLASRGCTCAFSLAARYSAESCAAPGATLGVELPPWQSVHPSSTDFVACMVGSSAVPWHEMQPPDLRSASSCICPLKVAGS